MPPRSLPNTRSRGRRRTGSAPPFRLSPGQPIDQDLRSQVAALTVSFGTRDTYSEHIAWYTSHFTPATPTFSDEEVLHFFARMRLARPSLSASHVRGVRSAINKVRQGKGLPDLSDPLLPATLASFDRTVDINNAHHLLLPDDLPPLDQPYHPYNLAMHISYHCLLRIYLMLSSVTHQLQPQIQHLNSENI